MAGARQPGRITAITFSFYFDTLTEAASDV